MSRREFIKQGLESAVLLYCAVELPIAYAETRGEKSPRRRFQSLPAFLDTLIPADATPSATQLGLQPTLLRHAEGIENYTRLIELGCEWLDTTSASLHRVTFDVASPPRRESVVTFAEASPENSIPRMFFERVRFDLFGLYYASPASWKGLGLSAPPQPRGYFDYAKLPPKQRG
jgi:hypothetical protein